MKILAIIGNVLYLLQMVGMSVFSFSTTTTTTTTTIYSSIDFLTLKLTFSTLLLIIK